MIVVNNIVAATDFGPASDSAIEYAAALARTLGARLHLVHVAGLGEEGSHAWQVLDALVESLKPVQAVAMVLRSPKTAEALLSYADAAQADLIVAGTHGRAGSRNPLDFFMGSIAQNLVRHAPCPVITTRGPVAAAA